MWVQQPCLRITVSEEIACFGSPQYLQTWVTPIQAEGMASSFRFGSADNGESLDISLFLCLDSALVPSVVAGQHKVGIHGH